MKKLILLTIIGLIISTYIYTCEINNSLFDYSDYDCKSYSDKLKV